VPPFRKGSKRGAGLIFRGQADLSNAFDRILVFLLDNLEKTCLSEAESFRVPQGASVQEGGPCPLLTGARIS
jgi:hypothetical protein